MQSEGAKQMGCTVCHNKAQSKVHVESQNHKRYGLGSATAVRQDLWSLKGFAAWLGSVETEPGAVKALKEDTWKSCITT